MSKVGEEEFEGVVNLATKIIVVKSDHMVLKGIEVGLS